jgi:hypothetical protein
MISFTDLMLGVSHRSYLQKPLAWGGEEKGVPVSLLVSEHRVEPTQVFPVGRTLVKLCCEEANT